MRMSWLDMDPAFRNEMMIIPAPPQLTSGSNSDSSGTRSESLILFSMPIALATMTISTRSCGVNVRRIGRNLVWDVAGIDRNRLRETHRGALARAQPIALGMANGGNFRRRDTEPDQLVLLVRRAVAALVRIRNRKADQQAHLARQRTQRHRR